MASNVKSEFRRRAGRVCECARFSVFSPGMREPAIFEPAISRRREVLGFRKVARLWLTLSFRWR